MRLCPFKWGSSEDTDVFRPIIVEQVLVHMLKRWLGELRVLTGGITSLHPAYSRPSMAVH